MEELLRTTRSCVNRGSWQEAEKHCEQLIKGWPLCIEAHYLLGQTHEQQEHWDDALAAYRRTVYLDRTFVMGMIGMARVWRRLSRPAEARRAYQNAATQLAKMRTDEAVLCADGVTAGELAGLVTRQASLEENQLIF